MSVRQTCTCACLTETKSLAERREHCLGSDTECNDYSGNEAE